MPWPATHILIAEKYYQQHFSHLDHQSFVIGTCFPDIRYPARVQRRQTHVSNPLLSQIKSCTPFNAGMLFHSLVDSLWNRHIHQNKDILFSAVPHNRAMFHTMKILQDKCLYPKYDSWQQVAGFFNTILPEELSFDISKALVIQWHHLLAHYLGKPPQEDDIKMLELSLPVDLVGKIRHNYQHYQENATLLHIMTAFYDQVETLSNER